MPISEIIFLTAIVIVFVGFAPHWVGRTIKHAILASGLVPRTEPSIRSGSAPLSCSLCILDGGCHVVERLLADAFHVLRSDHDADLCNHLLDDDVFHNA